MSNEKKMKLLMKKFSTHKKLPITNLEILQFYKYQLKEEIQLSTQKVEADYEDLKEIITPDHIIEEIVGDEGIHSDVMRYLAPFALKYRNLIFSDKIFKGMSGTMRKMQIVSFAAMLVGVLSYRLLNRKK